MINHGLNIRSTERQEEELNLMVGLRGTITRPHEVINNL